MISQITGVGADITERVTRTGTTETLSSPATSDAFSSKYRGAQGLDPDFIQELEKRFGFDKPLHERFFSMMKKYLHA